MDYHNERKDIMNGVISALDIDVNENDEFNIFGRDYINRKELDKLNDKTQPHEDISSIIQLLTSTLPLFTEIFKWTVKRNKLKRVNMEYKGLKITMEGDNAEEEAKKLLEHIKATSNI